VRVLQVGHEPVLNRVGPEYSLDLIEFRGCLLPDALARIQLGFAGHLRGAASGGLTNWFPRGGALPPSG
jgi:hypothetical protein